MDTLDGAQTFHLAEKIESVMQMMQVCLLNTGNVCVETEMPLENVIASTYSWIHQPPGQNQQMDRIKRWPSGLRLGRMVY
jgi:hypothetical protein